MESEINFFKHCVDIEYIFIILKYLTRGYHVAFIYSTILGTRLVYTLLMLPRNFS